MTPKRLPPFWVLVLCFFLLHGSLSAGLTAALRLPWTMPLPPPVGLGAGIPLLVLGFGLYGWSVKSLSLRRVMGKELFKSAAESTLVTGGAFAHSRNPIYFSLGFLFLGWFLVTRFTPLGIMTVLALVHFVLVAKWEEKELAARFEQAYADYKARVPFFIPSLRRKWLPVAGRR